MNTTRRVLSLLVLTLAVLIGGMFPASATFSETITAAVTLGTATIAPPTQLEAKNICTTTVDPLTLAATTTVTDIKIEWWESTSPRTTGYRVTVHPSPGAAYTLATTGQTNEIFVAPSSVRGQDPRISVTTLTGTSFTTQSVLVGITPC
jgi:hypothetical protein